MNNTHATILSRLTAGKLAALTGALTALAFSGAAGGAAAPAPADDITVASYYFGNYHPGDPRNAKMQGQGLVASGNWSRRPSRASPAISSRTCRCGATPTSRTRRSWPRRSTPRPTTASMPSSSTGTTTTTARSSTGRSTEGFLKATNNSRIKFAFMWANHDWLEIQPYKRGTPQKVLYPGKVTPANFEKICDHVIKSSG